MIDSGLQKRLPLIGVVILIVLSCWVIQAKPFRFGLDLSGGIRFLLEARPTVAAPKITTEKMDVLRSVLDRRVNKTGTEENVVQKVGENRILIEIPGTYDLDEARSVIGKTGNLEFRAFDPVTKQFVSTGLTGGDLSSAGASTGDKGWQIDLSFNDAGTQKFMDITRKLAPIEGKLGIFFDGQLQSAPVVHDIIAGGSANITGSFTRKEAEGMADILKAGNLPVDIEIIEESSIGPLLGKSSLDKSLHGGLIGLGAVILFMLLYYRLPGLFADVALVIYTLLLLAALKLSPSSLSLSGIAGIILSIGMAVDANILIFERTKEELISGKPIEKSIQLGFDRAFSSIFDSNMTTILSCGVLYYFGTGLVKGFAFNLALGVALSFFTAIFVTRTLMSLFPISGNIPLIFGINPNKIQHTAV